MTGAPSAAWPLLHQEEQAVPFRPNGVPLHDVPRVSPFSKARHTPGSRASPDTAVLRPAHLLSITLRHSFASCMRSCNAPAKQKALQMLLAFRVVRAERWCKKAWSVELCNKARGSRRVEFRVWELPKQQRASPSEGFLSAPSARTPCA